MQNLTDEPETAKICQYPHCRKPIPGWKRADAKFCSKTCGQANWQYKARREEDGNRTATCTECGEAFVLPGDGKGRRRSLCPQHDSSSPADCTGCGNRMRSQTATGLCRGCKPRAPGRQPQTFQQACKTCGGPYLGNWRQNYCSKPCRSSAERARNPESRRARDQHRRAVKAGVHAERFRDSEIFERDGWTCKLCGEPIDRTIKAPKSAAPSIDHIVPISRGGKHTRRNVQAAHLGCNARKHTRLVAPL